MASKSQHPDQTKEQLPRAAIKKILGELGVAELVAQATKGHRGATILLARMAERDDRVRDALLLLQPRRNPANARRREWVSLVELGGHRAKGGIHIIQGGSPGLKKR